MNESNNEGKKDIGNMMKIISENNAIKHQIPCIYVPTKCTHSKVYQLKVFFLCKKTSDGYDSFDLSYLFLER